MEDKQIITQYRDRLDKTLLSIELSNVESLRTLIESQMSKSTQSEDEDVNENLVRKRTDEVANFLSMLRSASAVEESNANEIPHGGWKIKQDNEDCRVMYREGPAGTPFHTLLVEGYVDGPLDVCLCITWEAGLYQKWWPQFNIPTFKLIASECVKKIRMGEEISLVRMKLPWPLSTREALVHFVSFDYFQDDLIIVLFNTISETENIDKSTHGFTRDGIPDAENVTRIDVVGGIALQKVSANRSFFRAIANMDVKLAFLPPAIINFASRQIIGSGFKLYQKKVASVTQGDVDFSKVLNEPFYGRIREALYTENNLSNGVLEPKDIKIANGVLQQQEIKILDGVSEQEAVKTSQPKEHCATQKEVKEQLPVTEIEEVEDVERSHEESNSSSSLFADRRREITISPDVNQALGTLEKVISVFREFGFSPRSFSLSQSVNNAFTNLEDDKSNNSKHFVKELASWNSQESRNSISSHISRLKVDDDGLAENNGINGKVKSKDESNMTQKKIKKQRFCCLKVTCGRLKS